jgi:hypothetical protein
MSPETIISLTTDDFAAVMTSMLAGQQPAPKVILLAQDPGTVVSHILQREGYQVHLGFGLTVLADAIAANPDLIVIEPKLLEKLLRRVP